PNKDLADQLTKKGPGLDGKLKKEMAKKLLDADLAAYVNMTAVNKQYGPQIQAGRQMIGFFSGQAAEQLGKKYAEMLQELLNGFFQFGEDGTAIHLTTEFLTDGLAFHFETRIGNETKTNDLFKAAKKSTFENMGKLPVGQLGYTGMSLTGPIDK